MYGVLKKLRLNRSLLFIRMFGGIFGGSLFSGSSWAFVHTSMFWEPNLNMPRPAGVNTGGYTTTGFGFTLEYMVTRRTGLEFGAIYEPQLLNGTLSDNLIIPVMYRFWFS